MRMFLAMFAVLWSGLVPASMAYADGVHARSEHFELFADADVDADTLLGDLEIMRDVVLTDLGIGTDVRTDPLRISIIDDMQTFALVTPSGLTAAAYLTTTISDDIIIGRSDDPDHILGDTLDPRWLRLVLRHETVHHLLDTHYPRKLPIWLGEGLAEYYSTFELGADGQVTFGRALPEQQTLPKTQPWLPMRTVIENVVTYPDFRSQPDRDAVSAQQLYYGQTFALAHYIMDQPNGLARVHRFVEDWDRNGDSEESFQRAFGLRYDPLETRVRDEIVRDGGALRISDAPTDRAVEINVKPLGPTAEAANRLRLLLTHGPANGRTAARIAALETELNGETVSQSNDLELARGLMAWRWRDWDAADAASNRVLGRDHDRMDDAARALKVHVKAAYGRLGERQMDDTLWINAETAARRALDADPDDAEMHMFRVAVSRPETVDLPAEAKASLEWLMGRNIHLRRPMTAMMTVPALLYEGRFDEADSVLDNAERWLNQPSDQAVIELYRNSVAQSREKLKISGTDSP